jgi:hypothetical protein
MHKRNKEKDMRKFLNPQNSYEEEKRPIFEQEKL